MKLTTNGTTLDIVSKYLFIVALILLYLLIAHFNFLMEIAVERTWQEQWFNTVNTGVWSFIFSIAIYKIYLDIKTIKEQ